MSEQEYEAWLQQNEEPLRRFITDFLRENVTVSVDVEREGDYYGSEWFTASASLNVSPW